LSGAESLDVSRFDSFKVVVPGPGEQLTMSNVGVGVTGLGGSTSWGLRFSQIAKFIIDAATNDVGRQSNGSLTISGAGVVPDELGFVQFRAGSGTGTLLVRNETARVDATAANGGTLNTTVFENAQLVTHQLRQSSLSVRAGGRVTILPDGTDAATSVLKSVTINAGGTLDISDNALVVDYTGSSPLAAIRSKIIEGRGGVGIGKGDWTGTGITSGAAREVNATMPESRSVGYAENALLPLGPYTTFHGQPVDNTTVLISYTHTADANLDGVVNDDDVTIVGAIYAPGVAQPHWALGDFDYNGFADDDDVTLLGALYQPTAAPLTATVGWAERSEAHARTDETVVARSPDRATATTEGLLVTRKSAETFGPSHVRGRETRAQRAETFVQSTRRLCDVELLDLLAESTLETRRRLSIFA
jgi:hypothetical protein